MNRIKFLLVAFVVTMVTLGIYSCVNQDTKQEFAEQAILSTRTIESTLINGIQLPENSQISKIGNIINFSLPNEFYLVGTSNLGNYYRKTGGKITCTCKEGSGNCTPTETDKTVGCNTEKSNPCLESNAKVSTSNMITDEFFTEYYIETPEDLNSNYALFSGTRQALDYIEWSDAEWLNLNEYNLHANEIQTIINFAYGKLGVDLQKLVDIPYFINNKKILLRVPFASLESGSLYSAYMDGTDTGKTSCSGCNGNCKLDTAAFGKVRICVGCNSGCSFSW